ncbi:MAG: PHP domain-containing protein [Polyangiaceae bacterium]
MVLGTVAVCLSPSACNPGSSALLRAKIIEQRNERVGGPVSAADVGDFLLENDRVRIAILSARPSPAPGVFGGSIVDADVRRDREGFEGGLGHDRFSEAFPVANLLVPNPAALDVRVLTDGSDGREAAIRVDGDGDFLYLALAILRDQKPVLGSIFPNTRTKLHFTTDYVLRPGESFVRMHTEVRIDANDQPTTCAPGPCDLECPSGRQQDANGCLTCACSEVLPLDLYAGSESVFGGILGDTPAVADPPAVKRAGIIGGDFVFFGNQNNVFAPGVGFDEDEAVQGAANVGRNTFTRPLTYDFVAAAGRDVSYGYFTGVEGAVVNVPIFASAATAFLVGAKNCAFDTTDDAACDAQRAFSYDRYLVIGDGDIASVKTQMDRILQHELGTVRGHVTSSKSGEGAAKAQVLVFSDPDSTIDFESIEDLVAANRAARGDVGLLNSIYADRGIDDVLDGDFSAELPPGEYLFAALDETYQRASRPVRATVVAGEPIELALDLPEPAYVEYRVRGTAGEPLAAKVGFISLDESGTPLTGDGERRVYAGESRLENGLRLQTFTASGDGATSIAPGRYRVVVSHGPEFSVDQRDIVLAAGSTERIDATLVHEVDTTGWMSIDMHLHSAPSFDSGMDVSKRVTTAAAEGLDIAVSTDHEVATDYAPYVRELGLETEMATSVSAEVTTLEYGHYIGFPLRYDQEDVPRHGAPDWSCLTTKQIISAIRDAGDGITPLTIVAHPRDGFFGYIDQSGVDTFTLNRQLGTLTKTNPIFRTATCDFDAMEIMGAKRLDLVRTPTVGEMVDWTRCRGRLDVAVSEVELLASCPEEQGGPGREPALTACAAGETFDACKRRNRSRLAFAFTKRMMERTEHEQALAFDFQGDEAASTALCEPSQYGDAPVPADVVDQPCAYRAGQVDDYFRYLEFGLTPTQVASSDSHDGAKEPGSPRTYFRSPTDQPNAVEIATVVDNLRAGHAVASYGPFVDATIDGRSFGDVVPASAGETKKLFLTIETASWFGVDRAEVYLNGHVLKVIDGATSPKEIYDVRVELPFEVPARDSWIVVTALGLRDVNQMHPIVLDIPYGEVQLSQLASGAFADVPVVNMLFAAEPAVPDWSAILPYAISNPIYLDVGGDGAYDAPKGPPPFCSAPCTSDAECPDGQRCLAEGLCGISIDGRCIVRRTSAGAD